MATTEYVILKNTPQPAASAGVRGGWNVVTTVHAASARAAISAAVNGEKDGGEFVAVPARSWQPMKVAVETALKFS